MIKYCFCRSNNWGVKVMKDDTITVDIKIKDSDQAIMFEKDEFLGVLKGAHPEASCAMEGSDFVVTLSDGRRAVMSSEELSKMKDFFELGGHTDYLEALKEVSVI